MMVKFFLHQQMARDVHIKSATAKMICLHLPSARLLDCAVIIDLFVSCWKPLSIQTLCMCAVGTAHELVQQADFGTQPTESSSPEASEDESNLPAMPYALHPSVMEPSGVGNDDVLFGSLETDTL